MPGGPAPWPRLPELKHVGTLEVVDDLVIRNRPPSSRINPTLSINFIPPDNSPFLAGLTLIRSRRMDRSNSAKTPHIWNIAFPAGVVMSMPR